MATLRKNWSPIYQHDWNDNTWTTGTPTTATKELGSTEWKTGSIDLMTNGYEGIQIAIDINIDTSKTYTIYTYYYASVDGTNWDDFPIRTKYWSLGSNFSDPFQYTDLIMGHAYLRIGFVQSTGLTYNHVADSIYYRAWSWKE